jgi:transcriptional regulator with XRE-family HTH domain
MVLPVRGAREDQGRLVAELDTAFGARVRAARERQGRSQKWLAEALGSRYGIQWYPTTVGKVESGERPVKLTEAVAVAQALGMLLEDLVYEHESVVRHDQGVHRAVAELEAAAERILARARSLHHESIDDDVDKAQRRYAVAAEAGTLPPDRQAAHDAAQRQRAARVEG